MQNGYRVYLRAPAATDREPIIAAYSRSGDIHFPWAYPPEDMDDYLQQPNRYLVCLHHTDEIVGTYNLSEIVRGWFHSAYLSYEAFVPHNGQGYMSEGLQLLLNEAFGPLNLHRLEANIQPDNYASLALVKRAGFTREGFSPRYLRIGGKEWKDHERWAIINDNWEE